MFNSPHVTRGQEETCASTAVKNVVSSHLQSGPIGALTTKGQGCCDTISGFSMVEHKKDQRSFLFRVITMSCDSFNYHIKSVVFSLHDTF